MSARGAIEALWALGLPDSFLVPNYVGSHAALYERVSELSDGGLSHCASRIHAGERVLDLGCGAGRLTAQLVTQGNTVTGVDIAPEMLARARSRVAQHGDVATIVNGDIRQWRGSERFDVVTLVGLTFSLLLSAEDRHAALRTAVQNVRPGGRVLLDFLPLDNVSDSLQHWAFPVRIGAMRGFTLIESRRNVHEREQIADVYTELARSDGRVVRIRSTTSSFLLSTSDVLALAAEYGLQPIADAPLAADVPEYELGRFLELKYQEPVAKHSKPGQGDPMTTKNEVDINDVVLRDLELTDRATIDEFFGVRRVNEGFISSGMHIDAAGFDIEQLVLLAQAQSADVKLWLATTGGGRPLCLQIFHKVGFPGVWTYSVVTGASVTENHGVGTQMIVLGLDRLFSDPLVHRLMGYISVIAPAPRRISERLGFVVEGIARSHIEMPDGTRVDALIVSMLRDEWVNSRLGAVSERPDDGREPEAAFERGER